MVSRLVGVAPNGVDMARELSKDFLSRSDNMGLAVGGWDCRGGATAPGSATLEGRGAGA